MMDVLTLLRQHEAELKKRFGVAMIGIFGPSIRGEERPDSDVDVLVTFRKEVESFDNYMDCKLYLEDLFGRGVDLIMKDGIKNQLKPYIPSEIAFAWNHAPYLDDIRISALLRGQRSAEISF